jgi:hypothetical protein
MNGNELKMVLIPQVTELTHAQIEVTSTDLISSVIEGWEDALELDLKLKFMEECIKSARAKIEMEARNLAEKESEKYGVKIAVRNGYAIYDLEKDAEYLKAKEALKSREEILKMAAKSKSMIYVTESGEEIQKPPVKSYTKSSVSYSFAK